MGGVGGRRKGNRNHINTVFIYEILKINVNIKQNLK